MYSQSLLIVSILQNPEAPLTPLAKSPVFLAAGIDNAFLLIGFVKLIGGHLEVEEFHSSHVPIELFSSFEDSSTFRKIIIFS